MTKQHGKARAGGTLRKGRDSPMVAPTHATSGRWHEWFHSPFPNRSSPRRGSRRENGIGMAMASVVEIYQLVPGSRLDLRVPARAQ